MFSFLRKKIDLNKSTTAKMFAVVMVCFLVFGITQEIFAAVTIPAGFTEISGSKIDGNSSIYKNSATGEYLRVYTSKGTITSTSPWTTTGPDGSIVINRSPISGSSRAGQSASGQNIVTENGGTANKVTAKNSNTGSDMTTTSSMSSSGLKTVTTTNNKTGTSTTELADCSFWKGDGVQCGLAKLVYYTTIKPASWAVMASGWLFDVVFEKTVLCLSSTIGKSPASGVCTSSGTFYPIIKEIWSVFRDLINMTFIFILLYAAINTILRTDTIGMKKTIGSVVMAAVLINFSLFFTEIIIDISNNFAVAIYNSITQNNSGSISAGVMSSLHMENFLQAAASGSNFTGIITISFFGAIFLLILAVVFFVISILFVVRFVTFIILMMMSPVGIGGSVVPKLQEKLGGKFWQDLIDQSFFAPVFMLFLWIIFKLLSAVTTIGGPDQPTNLAGTFTGDGNAKGIGYFLLSFSVVIFLLIKALEISKSMSSSGAGAAVQSGLIKYSGADWLEKKMRSAPASVAKNTVGVAARNVIGGTANYLAEKEGFRKWSRSNPLTKGVYGKVKDVADAKFGTNKGFVGVKKDREKDELAHDKWLSTLETPEQKKLREEAEKATREHAIDKNNIDLAAANAHLKGFEENTSKGSDETEKKLEAAKKDLEAARKLSTNPTMSEPARKLAEEKIADREKEVSDLEKQKKNEVGQALTKAFKNIKVDINPENPGSLAAAKKQAAYLNEKQKQGDTGGTGKHKFSDLQDKVENGSLDIEKLEKIAREQLRVSEAASHELKNIKANTADQQKITRIQYAQNLKDRRLGIIPRSPAAKGAAKAIEKEINKGEDKINEEKMLRRLAKMTKELSGEESAPTAPKAKKPTTT